ncbi:hypothetical protein E2C01_067134 [Portunus trituberculatus]|uniref:Uncharacterized protein n=1 Tax=Portunus trituberculatus TaxID=210409 RepID=A0A5B7HK64_PORTR|nr:hypothetical protein [Portunus trituberculatus]
MATPATIPAILSLADPHSTRCNIQRHKISVVPSEGLEVVGGSGGRGNKWKCDVVCYVIGSIGGCGVARIAVQVEYPSRGDRSGANTALCWVRPAEVPCLGRSGTLAAAKGENLPGPTTRPTCADPSHPWRRPVWGLLDKWSTWEGAGVAAVRTIGGGVTGTKGSTN